MPGPASRLYAQNVVNLLALMTVEDDEAAGGGSRFDPDFDDEVVAGAAVTHGGRIVHEPTREAIEGPDAPQEPETRPDPAPQPEPEQGALFDQEADQ
jgi:NAD(P) transhydrogenase subunit alpha